MLYYAEWSIAGDDAAPVDLDDPALWHAANPSLGIRRWNGTGLSEEFIAEVERGSMTDEEFARERLGMFAEDLGEDRVSAFVAQWPDCAHRDQPWPAEPAAIAFDMPPDRSSGAIGSAAPSNGTMCVDVLDHGPGTGWMADRLVELHRAHRRALFACDAGGPAGSLIPALSAAGVAVKALSTRDHQQACGAFHDAVVNQALVHRSRSELDAAVAGAARRPVGDAWLWSRTSSAVDISPLVVVTLAAHMARQKRTLNIENYGR